jgi:hypothetical protein
MQVEDVVIYDAFDEIEQTPADEKRTNKSAPRPKNIADSCSAKQKRYSYCSHDPRERVEDAIPHHIDFDVRNGVFRDPPSQHVMSL